MPNSATHGTQSLQNSKLGNARYAGAKNEMQPKLRMKKDEKRKRIVTLKCEARKKNFTLANARNAWGMKNSNYVPLFAEEPSKPPVVENQTKRNGLQEGEEEDAKMGMMRRR
jgi:hypothetical protein